MDDILIVGSIGLDTIETFYGKRDDLLGGSATYASISAGRFCPVNLVGVIGDDFPSEGKLIFKNYCNNIDDLKVKKGRTFRWGGRYHKNNDDRDTLFTELGVFENFKPQLSSVNKNIKWVFLANIHPMLQLDVLRQCSSKPKIIMDTMNLWINTTYDELISVINCADILLINESELIELTGDQDLEKGARKIIDMGPENIVVKCGSKGSISYSNDSVISVNVVPNCKVVDPTGAGDTFGAGLISGLVEGLDIFNSMVRGTVMASFCIEDFGIEAMLNLKEDEYLKRIKLITTT
ncbi:MAG: sugar kinase [Candidatus Marinimicrobia bacterium]|nr:sugar kinase [Candidatus Neomarinimicrobiota bacterium]